MSEVKKVVLAYSGGLDTSIIIPWLKEHYNNCEVIAVCGNVGQKGELEGLEERAKASGASKLYIEDLTDEFVEDYVIPTMQAGADYEGYLLGTSFARPILAKRVVEIARAEGADAVCHGSTGKGNDQVRFELAIMHFAPDLKIITPWREWDIQSRDEEIDYAEAHHIPLKISRETNYSKDKNLWHLSHEGLDLEDPGNEPQYDKPGFLELGVSPKTAPDKSEFVELEFEQGVPVALNGEKLKPAAIIAKLNEIGGRNGIGLYDVVENRLVGMKSRGVYETPGGTILYKAHEVLETLTLDKLTAHKKRELAITFGELVYDGQWFSPLRKALSAFVTSTQEHVTGRVRLELYKAKPEEQAEIFEEIKNYVPKPKKVKPNKVTVKQAEKAASNTIDENYDVPQKFLELYYRLHNAESLMRKSWEVTFDLNPKLLTHPEQVKVLRFALKPHLEFLKTLDEVLAESSGESSKTA